MASPTVSVIIPTHNRHEKVADRVRELERQSLPATDYEVIVVDDGSNPPVAISPAPGGPSLLIVRLGGGERSVARNTGAAAARGRLLVFLDDDRSVGEGHLVAFLAAAEKQPDALFVGDALLPDDWLERPFGRFRQQIEFVDHHAPVKPNFCDAGNMAISARIFQELEGFDRGIVSSEDQDLALRHSARGGQIVLVPEARTCHRDAASDIRKYCRRAEWGAEYMIPFCRRYPDWPDNAERERVSGYFVWGRDPISNGVNKLGKAVLGLPPLNEALLRGAELLERTAPRSKLLGRVYRTLVGISFFRGYRKGLARLGDVSPNEQKPRVPSLATEQTAR